MRVLVVGDIVGKPGRKAVNNLIPSLNLGHELDIVIANGENAAGGIGLTVSTANELFDSGIDVITSGNHIWAHKEINPYLDGDNAIIRPLNYPSSVPGRGYILYQGIVVVNLIGRTFMSNYDCPFRAMDNLLPEIRDKANIIIVDFHAEATSEKVAMGRYLDGRVSAVLGTHTHVGTIDTKILPAGTAYVTDIGMVGPVNSVIGDDIASVTERFLTQINRRLPVATGEVEFNAVLLELDEATGRALEIKRIHRIVS